MRTKLTVLAAAMAFNVVAPAMAGNNGLIDNDQAVNTYRAGLSIALRKAGHNDDWGGAARAFGVELEKGLAAPLPRPQMKWSSPTFTLNSKVVGGVVPPQEQLATGNIPFCADTAGQVIYKGHISPKGVVSEDRTAYAAPASSDGKRPCHAWLMQEGRKMQEQQANNAKPPTAPDKVSARTAPRSPAFAATN